MSLGVLDTIWKIDGPTLKVSAAGRFRVGSHVFFYAEVGGEPIATGRIAEINTGTDTITLDDMPAGAITVGDYVYMNRQDESKLHLVHSR